MNPKHFPEANTNMQKPESLTDDQCLPLPAWIGDYSNGVPATISCWEVSDEDLKRITETRQIWLHVIFAQQPPVSVMSENPFIYPENKSNE